MLLFFEHVVPWGRVPKKMAITIIYKSDTGKYCAHHVLTPDMQNFRYFTRARLFISRFNPKMREFCEIQYFDKTA